MNVSRLQPQRETLSLITYMVSMVVVDRTSHVLWSNMVCEFSTMITSTILRDGFIITTYVIQ